MWCVLTSTPFSFFSIMSPIPEWFCPLYYIIAGINGKNLSEDSKQSYDCLF